MTIIVRMPSGRVVEHTAQTVEDARSFVEGLQKLGLSAVIVSEEQ